MQLNIENFRKHYICPFSISISIIDILVKTWAWSVTYFCPFLFPDFSTHTIDVKKGEKLLCRWTPNKFSIKSAGKSITTKSDRFYRDPIGIWLRDLKIGFRYIEVSTFIWYISLNSKKMLTFTRQIAPEHPRLFQSLKKPWSTVTLGSV